jgi:hypothetical protein
VRSDRQWALPAVGVGYVDRSWEPAALSVSPLACGWSSCVARCASTSPQVLSAAFTFSTRSRDARSRAARMRRLLARSVLQKQVKMDALRAEVGELPEIAYPALHERLEQRLRRN